MLVLIGVLEDGTKELIAIHDRERESTLSCVKRAPLATPKLLPIMNEVSNFVR